MTKKDVDAIVVGSGPNGLAAAITLRRAGLSVLLIEAKDTIGGGLRSLAFTLPGYIHDVCSAIHPMAVLSPFFSRLPLEQYGLRYIYPPVPVAHPFDDGMVAALRHSIHDTAAAMGPDESAYLRLLGPLVRDWPLVAEDVLGPLHWPAHPVAMARFGLSGLLPATRLLQRFQTREARALLAGMAAHGLQPLSNVASSAIGLVLAIAGHLRGWPFPAGGSQSLADALAAYFVSLGGQVQTGTYIRSMSQLPSSHAVLFDVTPRQLLEIAGHRFSSFYRWQLERYRYGMGVFKVDWALAEPIPFRSAVCREAGTVHLGNTMEEIVAGEQLVSDGGYPENPFVLLAQQSLFDASRAPEGKHTAWAYCHVPHESVRDMTDAIEKQVERFAPGFRERILARHTMNTVQMEEYNPNYVGGDINGGMIDIGQLFTRPALRSSPYRSPAKGIYICSSSTPPGGGVHGLCGYHAARTALKDVFFKNIDFKSL